MRLTQSASHWGFCRALVSPGASSLAMVLAPFHWAYLKRRGIAAVASKPLLRWSILILRAKAVWIGDIDAASEAGPSRSVRSSSVRTLSG